MELFGHFFRPQSSKRDSGKIIVVDGVASITSDGATVCEGAGIQSVQNKRDIYLDNDYLFALAEPLTSEQEKLILGKTERGIAWLENFSLSKALLLSLSLMAILAALRYALTFITPLAVSIFPQEWEKTIGRNSYQALESTVFSKTQLPSTQVERLRIKARQMASANGFESPEIFFHQVSRLGGPNAAAFPGGPIVVTDDLVTLLEKDELVLGVIAHEFAHIQERHSLHYVIEAIGVAVIASVVLGADDVLIEEMSAVAVNLWVSQQSREFEKQSDLLAVEYLEKADLDKAALGLALKKLTEYFCSLSPGQSVQECLEETESGWLSSHPSGAERLEYLSDQ
ncbi:MAG: M48 family metallopeptidase [Gammaproteobacteria bacterium AqS3]|nr:M48 family metallopeptidase [Gammaproteobacteria bacterium AqS3]